MPRFDFLRFCRVCSDRCCTGSILATSEERERIVAQSGRDHFEPDGDDLYTIRADGDCPYLGEGGLCTVYDVRPEVCRMYPYWPEVQDGQVRIPWDETCPAAPHLPRALREELEARARALVETLGVEAYERWYNSP